MENLIEIVNKLQEIMVKASVNCKLKLPQMVIVGAQSSGKSSIIESLVGKEFLPRGTGIVTRRPLILQLKNINKVNINTINNNSSPSFTEWGEFNHLEGKKFDKFTEIRQEIEKDTAKIAGNNKGISHVPIVLKIFSPNVVDLTLVDLPGLVNVPVGDQPIDIDSQVRDLVLEYIRNPNAIILAVSAASTDIANSESLKICREVDPQYQRTLGIITKIDLMDKGTDCIDVLNNKVFPLRYGYIGVILRSQFDIKQNKSLNEGLKSEREFFNGNPIYNQSNKLGVSCLVSTLQEVLVSHIRDLIPSIRDDISNNIFEKKNELEALGGDESMFEKEELINAFILNMVSKFSQSYNEMIDGNFIKDCNKFYIGGARINYIYQEIFKKEIEGIDPFDQLSDDDIRTAIKNSNGLRPSLFIPEQAFEVLVKQQISRLSYPSLYCVKKVHEELKKIVDFININEISRYNKLEIKIKIVMNNVLDKLLEPTNQMIKNLIEIERSYINTTHPDFLGPEQSVLNLFDERTNISDNNSNNQNTGNNMNNQNKPKDKIVRNYPLNSYQGSYGVNNNKFSNNINLNSNFNQVKKNKFKDEDEEELKQNQINEENVSVSQNNFPNQMRPGFPSSRDIMETCIIKNLISSYYHVVKKNISDLVPKTIMCFLVNESKRMAETEMINQLYKSSELDTLLQEDPYIARKRKSTRETLGNLKDSLHILSEIKDLKI
jgi:dynamin 1-like protein